MDGIATGGYGGAYGAPHMDLTASAGGFDLAAETTGQKTGES